MSYSLKTIAQGREFLKELLPEPNITNITKKTSGFVASNLQKIWGVNPSLNIEVQRQLNEIKLHFSDLLKTETLEDIFKRAHQTSDDHQELNSLAMRSDKQTTTRLA